MLFRSLGPIEWRHRFIQSELDDLEVSFTVPPAEQGYIKINDNFEIFPVGEPVGESLDPNFEQPIGPTWQFVDVEKVLDENPQQRAVVIVPTAIPTYGKQDKDLGEIRTTVNSLVASIRYNKEQAGTKVILVPEVTGEVTVPKINEETKEIEQVTETRVLSPAVEVTADTSRDGRAIFVQVYATMPDGGTVDWKFPEGWMNITKEQLGMVIAGGYSYIQEQFLWEKGITDRVASASTIEDLKTIYNEINPVVVPTPGV